MRTDDARKILSDKCRHYGLTITANDALTENTQIIMAALSAMQVAFETGRADAVHEMEAAGIRLLG